MAFTRSRKKADTSGTIKKARVDGPCCCVTAFMFAIAVGVEPREMPPNPAQITAALLLASASPALAQKEIPKAEGHDQCPLGYVNTLGGPPAFHPSTTKLLQPMERPAEKGG